MNKISNNQILSKKTKASEGYSLIIVLVMALFGIMVMTTSLAMIVSSTQATIAGISSEQVATVAESAAEDAILKLLRNPMYSGGQFLMDGSTAEVVITGQPNTPIMSIIATSSGVTKQMTVELTRSAGMLEIISWRE